jgi:hypothetical protein
MTREELIDALASRVDAPAHSAQVFLHACFDIVKSALRAGEEVELPDIGAWKPRLDANGILIGVSYAAFVPAAPAVAQEVRFGPVTGIDPRHFIPARALEISAPVARTSVDIAGLVAEVEAAFSPGGIDAAGGTVKPEGAIGVRSATRPAEAGELPTDVGDPPAEAGDLPVEAVVAPEGTAGAPVDSVPADEEPSAGGSPAGGPWLEPELVLAENAGPGQEAGLAEEIIGAVDPVTGHADAGRDPLSDEAVFHRNRDQLYHPPEEPSKRPLILTAVILTVLVLFIIVYMLLDKTEPRELPGTETVGMVVANRTAPVHE